MRREEVDDDAEKDCLQDAGESLEDAGEDQGLGGAVHPVEGEGR